jgi:hypothetical protein
VIEVEHRLVEPCHHGAEAEWSVVVELQFECPRRPFERLLFLARAGDVEVAAGHDPAPLLGVPPELESAAVGHVGAASLFRRLIVNLEVAAQAVVRFGDHDAVDPMLGRELE